MYIFKTDQFENIWWRIERRTNQLAHEGQLDGYHASNILRSFSRGHHNKMVGQEKMFVNLEPTILKTMDSMSDRDVTHVMYAYGVRKAGNPKLHEAFEKRLTAMARQLDYPGLFNATYYLMFTDNKNESLWFDIIDNCSRQEAVLPLTYYRPFKAASHYCAHLFPHWMQETQEESGSFLSDLTDKFFYAEKYFNVVKFDDMYETEQSYKDLRAFLTGHCNVYPVPFITIHNLFNMHFVFSE